ncbi:undecaprenyl-diphosphatase [Streptomyces sp. CG 926]|uniref:phosphatase PAP2 family protein n=1 Tax=Streptomyces sp. CG 926 TaxID=1882405 RepID=UPI000D6C2EA9|nr:phosphatase PAP2 family protein [Streptomyces sp. CG 926]PWK64466.1 undecaprenyl-diphosphatase [Streptomyces sp. CG 926]
MTGLRLGAGSFDANTYLDIVETAHDAPAWLDHLITAYSDYGLVVFAILMLLAWHRARHLSPAKALMALATPVLTLIAFVVSSVLKPVLHESRPCRSLHVITLEACPAPSDWSFPSNHATLAAAAAVALWFASKRLGAVAVPAALAMAASRVWVGAHYPHDIAAGLVVGSVVAALTAVPLSRHAQTLAARLDRSRLRALVAA